MTREEYGDVYQAAHIRTVRFLMSKGASSTLAADIAQSAWLRGWERLSQLREPSMLLTWINTIALNEYRRQMARETAFHRVRNGELQRGIPLRNHATFAAIEIARILAACNPADRQLLEAQMNGVTPRELACQHGITETAVRIRFLRARRSARAAFEKGRSASALTADPALVANAQAERSATGVCRRER
jgi:DNA-directed RNA polymerase specialized sigma24 family protein